MALPSRSGLWPQPSMMMSASGPRLSVTIQKPPKSFSLKSRVLLIARLAVRALQKFVDAADGEDRDHEEDGDEAHALLHDEVLNHVAVRAPHRLRRGLGAPRQKV